MGIGIIKKNLHYDALHCSNNNCISYWGLLLLYKISDEKVWPRQTKQLCFSILWPQMFKVLTKIFVLSLFYFVFALLLHLFFIITLLLSSVLSLPPWLDILGVYLGIDEATMTHTNIRQQQSTNQLYNVWVVHRVDDTAKYPTISSFST